MALQTIPLLGPTQESRLFRINPQRSINLFASIEKPGAKSQVTLFPTPGLTLVDEPCTGPTRSNGVKWNGDLYFVIGTTLIKIATGNIITQYTGVILTSAGRVSIARGRDDLLLVDGTYGYSFDGATLAKVIDADFPASPTHATYLDGYFIVNSDGTDDYFISAIDNPASWAALDSSTALGKPDDITALIATSKDVYLLGPSSAEPHFNSQNPDFPFEAYPGGVLDIGIAAPYSVVSTSKGLIYLSGNDDEGDACVVRVTGFSYEVLSDDDMNFQINNLDTISDAFGMVYTRHGRTFYVLTFPTSDKTFVIDLSTKLWHTRKSVDIGRWRAAGIGYLGNTHYVGDYSTGKIYSMSDSVYDEAGDTIERERYTQVTHINRNRFTTHRLEVEFKPGVGLTSGQGSDPQVMMRYSNDGGNTWSSELWQSIGKIGEYHVRSVWENLGESRERIYHFKVTDPVEVIIVAAYADIEVHSD